MAERQLLEECVGKSRKALLTVRLALSGFRGYVEFSISPE